MKQAIRKTMDMAWRLPASASRHVLIWSVLLFANIGSVVKENP